MTITQEQLDRTEKWMQFLRDEGIIPPHIRVLVYDASRPLDWIIDALKKHY